MTNDIREAAAALNWRVAPTLFQGEGARPILETYQERAGDNEFINRYTYDEPTQTVRGSSPIMNEGLGTILEPAGIKIADVNDLYKPEVRAMLDGKFYSDPTAFVLRGRKNKGYERNTPFIDQLVALVEETNGQAQFPLFITGWDTKPLPEDKRGYGLQIVKRKDFSAVHDSRLAGENDGKRFNTVEEPGFPVFTKDGKYTFFANDNATLSRLYVSSDGDLDLYGGNVASSGDDGRVVLLPAEGGAQKILNARFSDLARTREEQMTQVEIHYKAAQKVLSGEQ